MLFICLSFVLCSIVSVFCSRSIHVCLCCFCVLVVCCFFFVFDVLFVSMHVVLVVWCALFVFACCCVFVSIVAFCVFVV